MNKTKKRTIGGSITEYWDKFKNKLTSLTSSFNSASSPSYHPSYSPPYPPLYTPKMGGTKRRRAGSTALAHLVGGKRRKTRKGRKSRQGKK